MAACAKGSESPVARFELQMPLIPQRPRIEAPVNASMGGARAQVSTKRLLIGVIDSGCPFAHHQLRSGSGTRVLGLWDQNENSGFANVGGSPPGDLGYGCEITQASLNELIARCSPGGVVCEDTCYSAAGYREVGRRMAHGAAVLGLLAGDVPLTLKAPNDPDHVPRWTELEGEAVRDADIAFVQLPRDAVQDSSSAGLPRLLLDGLRYILSLASDETEHIVVNLSEGSSRGTHDGESIFEKALLELVALDPRLKIVIAAGNTYDEQRHAVLGGTGAARGPVTFRLPPGCESGAAVVVRMPNVEGLELRVTAPGEDDPVRVEAGQAQAWPVGGHVACAVIYPARPSDAKAHLALIAWRPTELAAGGWQKSFAGDWKIEVWHAPADDPVHLYVCRNQINPGALPRATQGAFVDADETYDPCRSIRSSRADAGDTRSPIRRQGGLTALSTLQASRITVVGGYIQREGDMALYSSDGPAAGARPPRQGPDRNAPVDESFAVPGIRVAGSRSGSTVRVRGTSFAAPQIARLIADELLGPSIAVDPDLQQWLQSFNEQSRKERRRQRP